MQISGKFELNRVLAEELFASFPTFLPPLQKGAVFLYILPVFFADLT